MLMNPVSILVLMDSRIKIKKQRKEVIRDREFQSLF